MTLSPEIIALIVAAAPCVASLVVIAHRLGMIHADFRRVVQVITDHETRLRTLEKGDCK